MADYPPAGRVTDPARTTGQIRTDYDSWLAADKQALGQAAREAATIVGGVLTHTDGVVDVGGEGGAADDLDSIVQTNHPDGRLLMIFPANPGAENITVRNAQGGAGQILTIDSQNVLLDASKKGMILQRVGTSWVEVQRLFGNDKAAMRAFENQGTASVEDTGTADGELPKNQDLYGLHTIWLPAGAMWAADPQAPAGGITVIGAATANHVSRVGVPFDNVTEQALHFGFQMPASWDVANPDLFARFLYFHEGGQTPGSDDVSFGIRLVGFGDGEGYDAQVMGSEVTMTKTGVAADTHWRSPLSAAITPAGTLAAGDMVMGQIARKVGIANNLDLLAYLVGVEILYAINAVNDGATP